MPRQIWNIVKLNFKLEWRLKQSYFAVALYTLISAYLSYLVFNGSVSSVVWNNLFWLILVFASVQVSFRSFQLEAERRFLLYFGLIPPQVLILGKTLYNFLYVLLVGEFTALIFSFLFGNEIHDFWAFQTILILASLGFASILSFTAGIASKASDNPALPAILSVPLLFPQLITLSKLSKEAITGFSWELNAPFLIVLALLSLISILLSYLLFTYLWRD